MSPRAMPWHSIGQHLKVRKYCINSVYRFRLKNAQNSDWKKSSRQGINFVWILIFNPSIIGLLISKWLIFYLSDAVKGIDYRKRVAVCDNVLPNILRKVTSVTVSLAILLSLTHTHTLSLCHCHCLSCAHSLSLLHIHSYCYTHTLSLSFSLTVSPSDSLLVSLTLLLFLSFSFCLLSCLA